VTPSVPPDTAAARPVDVPPPHEGVHQARGRQTLGRLLAELVRFGTVGLVAFVVDVGLFNLLRYGPGEVLEAKPLTAKVISAAVATLVAWVGNRYWVFARHRTESRLRELGAFVLANIGGMLVAVGCLAFSHYVLQLTSPLADNISANVVGLGLGTAFRYVAYKRFVFTGTGAASHTAAGSSTGTRSSTSTRSSTAVGSSTGTRSSTAARGSVRASSDTSASTAISAGSDRHE
jgi:putative flippase GtrA